MITIAAHGVPQMIDNPFAPVELSPMQYRLLTDPAPIRICGAPTGAGKTYAFLQDIRIQRHVVLFVVPTQALAANIAETAHAQQVDAVVWDNIQHNTLVRDGQNVWITRLNEYYRMEHKGGIIITTPETLGQIFLGVPYRHVRPEMDVELLLSSHHIVFDEVHLLTERALGFLQAWMTLMAGLALQRTPKAHLTFLSATHSNMLSRLVGSDIPEQFVSYFDEEIVTPTETVPSNLRVLHGTVTISFDASTVPDLLHRHLGDWMTRHQRVLVVFDSLKQYSQSAGVIQNDALNAGLSPDQVFVVTGQERQAGRVLDAVRFDVGITPQQHHRLIIGTSALEVGITYPEVSAAIIDVGLTPAALVQRIGRVARGDQDGEVLVATPSHSVPSHFLTLKHLDGQMMTAEEFRTAFAPFVPIHWGRARSLGSAYWSMMQHTHAPAYQALRTLYERMSARAPLGAQLNQLRREAKELPRNGQRIYLQWLDAVDKTLQDIRGFSPTISLQFAQGDPITYARDWALRYLRDPDRIDIEHNRWIYDKPRDACLLEVPRSITMNLLLPTLDQSLSITLPPGANAYGRALEQYVAAIRGASQFAFHPIWEHTCQFILATGLLIWDSDSSGSKIDIPPLDGSFAL